MTSDNDKHAANAKRGALGLVLAYAGFSSLWLVFSDAALGLLFYECEIIAEGSLLKDGVFVVVTALLLYFLVCRLIGAASDSLVREQAARREAECRSGLLETIVNNAGDAIFAKDRTGCYLLFNQEAARITGIQAAQAIGRDDTTLFPPAQVEMIRANDLRVMNSGTVQRCEECVSTVDGDRVFLTTKGPLRTPDGHVIGIYGFSRDITGRQLAEETLRKSEECFRMFFEKNSSVMLLINPVSGEILDANGEAVRFYGYDRERLLTLSINDISNSSPELVALQRQEALHGRRTVFGFQHRLSSGEIREVESYVTPIESTGQPRLLSIVHDVTDRKRVEKALQESEERLRLALSASKQGWFDVNLQSGKVDVSPEYVKMIGFEHDGFESDLENWLAHVHPDDRVALSAEIDRCVKDGGPRTAEYRRETQRGDWCWIRSVGKVVEWGADQKALRLIGIHTDITEWKKMEDHVRQLAFFDTLTGLPNRRLLNDRMTQAMSVSKRSNRYCALMFIDLDNFKPLNDTHGHEAGDLLLVEVAARMRRCVREADTVARFGGDEFVVMIGELDRNVIELVTAQARSIAEKIRDSLARPYRFTLRRADGATVPVVHRCSASIGVTLFVNHEVDAVEILKRADLAMYRAKEAGRNTICFYA